MVTRLRSYWGSYNLLLRKLDLGEGKYMNLVHKCSDQSYKIIVSSISDRWLSYPERLKVMDGLGLQLEWLNFLNVSSSSLFWCPTAVKISMKPIANLGQTGRRKEVAVNRKAMKSEIEEHR